MIHLFYGNEANNLVDFSNPESVARSQLPPNFTVYNNPYANPNIQYNATPPNSNAGVTVYGNQQPMQFMAVNPYQPFTQNTIWCNSPYYTGPVASAAETAKFMIPPEGSSRRLKITVGPKSEQPEAPVPDRYKDWLPFGRRHEKPIQVYITYVPKEQPKDDRSDPYYTQYVDTPTEKYLPGMPYKLIYKPRPEHEPGVPFTQEELDPDYYTLRIIPDSPLDWTKDDEKELDQLCKAILVYDRALPFVAWNWIHEEKFNKYKWYEFDFDNNKNRMTREDWRYIKKYLRHKLQQYRILESQNKENIDYRAPLNNRPIPDFICYYDDDHNPILRSILKTPTEPARYKIERGIKKYEINRGPADGSMFAEDWELFVHRAFCELFDWCTKCRTIDYFRVNAKYYGLEDLYYQEYEEERNKLIPTEQERNSKDPVQIRINKMKEYELNRFDHKWFFKRQMRDKLNEEEFEKWWYGPTYEVERAEMTEEEKYEQWAAQAHRRHLRVLQAWQQDNPEELRRRALEEMSRRMYNWHKGAIRRDMSLAEFMERLRYIGDIRFQEEEIQQQAKSAASKGRLIIGKEITRNNIRRINPNPPSVPREDGTIDPRLAQLKHAVAVGSDRRPLSSYHVIHDH